MALRVASLEVCAGKADMKQASDVPVRAALCLMAMLAFVTILSQFFRSSLGVIGPEVIRELGLSSGELGLANASFFIALLLAQIPVGLAFDRIGPRLTVTLLSGFAVAGALLHTSVETASGLVASRFLLGLGCAASFMATIVLSTRWYAPSLWSTVLSWTFALSQLGIVLSGTPLAFVASQWGWRSAFVVAAALAALAGLLFWALVRDYPPGVARPAAARLDDRPLAGLLQVLRTPGLYRVLALQLVAYSSIATVMGLWAGPYLFDVHELSPLARGNVLVAMAFAQTVGTLCYGPLDRLINSRKWLVMGGGSLSVMILLALAAVPKPSFAAALTLLILLCFIGSYGPVLVAHTRSLFPDHLAGRGATTGNIAQLLGSVGLPLTTGLLPLAFPSIGAGYAPAAYQLIFLFIAVCLAAGLACYGTAADSRPKEL